MRRVDLVELYVFLMENRKRMDKELWDELFKFARREDDKPLSNTAALWLHIFAYRRPRKLSHELKEFLR
jgi:hypothetical protein